MAKKGTNPLTDLQDPTPMKFKDQINLASGDAQFVGQYTNAIKLACLNFNTSPIVYQDTEYGQEELLSVTQGILKSIQRRLASNRIQKDFLAKSKGDETLYIDSLLRKANQLFNEKQFKE